MKKVQKLKVSSELHAALKKVQKLGESPKVRRHRVVKTEIADVLGMTNNDLKAMASQLNVVGLTTLIGKLAAELRKLNALAADAEGVSNETAQHLTHGETLSKSDVAATQRELERNLETVISVHENKQRNAPVNDGEIKLARNAPRNMDQLEKWAEDRRELAQRLNYFPDTDNVASALGITPKNQALAKQFKKDTQIMPNDSYCDAGTLQRGRRTHRDFTNTRRTVAKSINGNNKASEQDIDLTGISI